MPLALGLSRLWKTLFFRGGHSIKIHAAWLMFVVSLHVAAMMLIEKMRFIEAVWVTVITVTTVGYGDKYAQTDAGKIATMVLICGGAVFVLAALASLFFERIAEARARKNAGKWRWKLRDHLLIISTTGNEAPRYLVALVEQLRQEADYADRCIQIMTHGFDEAGGLPDALRELNVTFVSGDGDTDYELEFATARDAHLVVVLGDERQAKADAFVFDVVTRLRSHGFSGRIVSECVDDHNRARLCTREGDGCIRPVRGYPEMMARAILAAGAEQVIEEIFTGGGAECELLQFSYEGSWSDICIAFIQADLGMPLGYRAGGRVVTAPRAADHVVCDGIYAVLPDGMTTKAAEAAQAITLRLAA